MSSPVGLTLRLLGPLIELICLIMLRKWGGQGRFVAGLSVEALLYTGMGLGFGMVVAGLTWFRPRAVDAPAGSHRP